MKDAAAAELPELAAPDIDRCINKYVYEKTFSAASCVASVGNRMFHRAVYGSATQPPPLRRIDHTALFDLASLSKPLGAGLATLYLASRNRIDLNAPLSRTLPELRDARFDKVDISMLLDHTAGFPATADLWQRSDELGGAPDKLKGTPATITWARQQLAASDFAYTPGSKTIYSDIGFMLLAWIIEGIVRKPLDVFLTQEIYKPLGLHNDLFFVRAGDFKQQRQIARRSFAATERCPWRGKVMQGEVHDRDAWLLGGVAGHAGLFGTADAVWRLCRILWASHKGEDSSFLAGTVRRFWTRSKRVRDTTRALAWDTPSVNDSSAGKRFSRNAIGHLGFTGTSIWMDLSTDVIGVVLSNAVHPTVDGKREAMAEFRPRVYDLIAKEGEALPPLKDNAPTNYYTLPPGAGLPLNNPLRGPGK